jgi:hypothetical protein
MLESGARFQSALVAFVAEFGPWCGLLVAAVVLGGWWLGRRRSVRILAESKSAHDLRVQSCSVMQELARITEELTVERAKVESMKLAEPLLPFIAGAEPNVPPMITRGLFLAARKRIAETHAATGDHPVRSYVRADIIDAYLALWVDLVGGEDSAGIPANRDRLAGIDEPGLDALLGAELALVTYVEDDEATVALAGALAGAAALVRDNLLLAGVVVDRPRLLCPAGLASTGFRAMLEPGDRTRTAWIAAAQAVIESDAFTRVDPETVVVAVEQFGVKRDGRVVRATRLCGYNPPEWRRP